MNATIEFKRIDNDVNGNPRYVCHFLNLNGNYENAVKLANKIGGRKYHTKKYGGGIVFQSYSLDSLVNDINQLLLDRSDREYIDYTVSK
jgi:hypothetical protein